VSTIELVLGAQGFPFDALNEVLAVEHLGFGFRKTAYQQFAIERRFIASALPMITAACNAPR